MNIRACMPDDLSAITELAIDTVRPLLADELVRPRLAVTAHDHAHWEDDYRQEVPALLDPPNDRFITLAEKAAESPALRRPRFSALGRTPAGLWSAPLLTVRRRCDPRSPA
jgi:hypothetical protein